MKEIAYRDFSLRSHQAQGLLRRPSVCQFELTFRCGLHCSHCYTDCYNRPSCAAKELNTGDIKKVLDKIYSLGVVWLCLTGGDPVARPDFIEIYQYSKEKGFIVTVFTSGYFCRDEVMKLFKESPPFSIEITLNAVARGPYEKISHVKGSFERVMKNVHCMRRARLPLTIKAQVTKENILELPSIRKFVRRYNFNFLPSVFLYPRLNGDPAPCRLRLSPEEVLRLDGVKISTQRGCLKNNKRHRSRENDLFPCAVQGGDGFFVDPQGRIFLCPLLREFHQNILEADAREAYEELLSGLRQMKFVSESACKTCGYLSKNCLWCPGKANVEKGDWERPVAYFCELARLEAPYV